MNSSYFLRLQSKSLKLLGFDIHAEQQIFKRPAIAMLSILPMLTFCVPMMGYVLDNITDVDEATQAMASLVVAFLSLAKFGLLVYSRKEIAQLLVNLRHRLAEEWRQDRIYADIIEDANRRNQVFSRIFIFFTIIAATAANLVPLLEMLSSYLLTGHTEPICPFPCNYSWDVHKPLFYMVSYVWDATTGYAIVIVLISTDTLFSALSSNLCALFRIAVYKMTHIQLDDTAALGEVLKLHQSTLEISAEFNSCFQKLICVQFLLSSLQLCLIGYQVAANFSEPIIVFNFFFILSIGTQVYIYAVSGENLKQESAKFAEAVYESPWYEASKSVATSLHIALRRSQRPCLMTAYFFEANMITFSSIVRTTGSYITLLRSFK